MPRRVADDLLEVLVQAGVTRVYGLVGDSLNAFSDAVRRSGGAAKGGIDWVHVHNEEGAAVFTADTGMCCTWTARYITPQRAAAAARLLGTRLDGQRAADGYRSSGVQPGPAGRLAVR
jgi:Thiamine pyrophosphate enzyme, N-terminal TPP binding domain